MFSSSSSIDELVVHVSFWNELNQDHGTSGSPEIAEILSAAAMLNGTAQDCNSAPWVSSMISHLLGKSVQD